MTNELFSNFIKPEHIDYYTNQLASKLNLKTKSYFTDKLTGNHYESVSQFHNIDWVRRLDYYRRTFRLTKAKSIMKTGLEDYVLVNRKLVFNLTVTGRSFIYTVEFYNPDETTPAFVGDNNIVYAEDNCTHQLSFIL